MSSCSSRFDGLRVLMIFELAALLCTGGLELSEVVTPHRNVKTEVNVCIKGILYR